MKEKISQFRKFVDNKIDNINYNLAKVAWPFDIGIASVALALYSSPVGVAAGLGLYAIDRWKISRYDKKHNIAKVESTNLFDLLDPHKHVDLGRFRFFNWNREATATEQQQQQRTTEPQNNTPEPNPQVNTPPAREVNQENRDPNEQPRVPVVQAPVYVV